VRLKEDIKKGLIRAGMRLMARRSGISSGVPREKEAKTIALWQFSGLGDMLLATPVIRALHNRWPQAKIYIWCSHPHAAEFLCRFPNVQGVHAIPIFDFDARTLLHKGVRRRLETILNEMREQTPDVLVNLHVPAMLDWWFVEWWLIRKMRIPFSLGFNPRFIRQRSVFDVSLNASVRDHTHYTVLYQRLLEQAGIECDKRTEFPMSDVERENAVKLLADCNISGNRQVCMHIGGNRLKMEGKLWPVERFVELAERMVGEGLVPVLVGVQQERDLGERLCASVPACVNLIGCTQMGEMAALIGMVSGFIGHDSGPFHVAVAMGVPCVAICGRSDAEPEYLNYNLGPVSVIVAPTPELISVDAVLTAAMRQINMRES